MNEPITVLIIDPDAEDRARCHHALKQHPYQPYTVYEAESGNDGLQAFGLCYPDVLILEFDLPDMTGLNLIHELHRVHPVPVVMLTGKGTEEIAVQALKQGAHDYISKHQFEPDRLHHAISGAIQQCHLEELLRESRERQRLIATTALRIRQSLDVPQILNTAVAEVRELLRCDRVLVYQFDGDRHGTIVAESVANGWSSTLGQRIQGSCFQADFRKSYLTYREYAIPNVDTADLSDCHLKLLERFNVKANLIVPLVFQGAAPDSETRTLWGLLIAHQCSTPRQWRDEELEILNALAVQLSIGIQHGELLKRTQDSLTKEREFNAFKSRIIKTVSHEYRTPLTMILGGAELLERYHDRFDDEKKLKYLRQIQHAAAHMTDLVNDLLFANQVELNQIRFQPICLDIVDFVQDLVEEHQQIASERHRIQFTHRGKHREFCGDTSLLRQMISNLLSNAVKYSPDGGLVDVMLRLEPDELTLQVKDEGIGIPEADRDRLFQAFGRASNVDTIAGTGLGLMIAESCVQMHDGQISVDSEVGKGTTVTIKLPCSCPNVSTLDNL